ncbi:MAG TPA: rhodanese-like domain-containing protein, partial [Anditalea sp.]|nr:rhodanese-like domain-containing protein [Anditalea sp.]
ILKKALVFGAIYQHEGQVAILNVHDRETEPLTYRDLFPNPPLAAEVPNCAETGVLGVLPGIIGTMQATEAIKLLSGFGKPLIHKVLFYNLKDHGTYELDIKLNPEGRKLMPTSAAEFKKMDYAVVCGPQDRISWDEAQDMIKEKSENTILLDVREVHEMPKLERFAYTSLPLSGLLNKTQKVDKAETILVFCQSGVRSQRAVEDLKAAMPAKKIYSIEGGMNALLQKS